jgi:hypothetical protein
MPRNHRIPCFFLFIALFFVTDCKSPAPSNSGSSNDKLASSPANDWPPEVATPGLSLIEQLQKEATLRPSETIRAEAIFSALSSQGIVVPKTTQVLARPIGARFCLSGMSDLGLTVVACEFSNNEEAHKGLTYSEKTFGPWIPNRRLYVNQKTLLTLTPAHQRPPLVAQEAAITHIFQTL